VFDATSADPKHPFTQLGWTLMADVRGKQKGWIATEFSPASELVFLVPVKQVLEITYLTTYENISPIQVKVGTLYDFLFGVLLCSCFSSFFTYTIHRYFNIC
jgi:hypothetical protein